MGAELSRSEVRFNARILEEIKTLEARSGAFVPMVKLRKALWDIDPEVLTGHLRRMSRQRTVHLVPDSNRKTLTAADALAAVVIGDQANHLVARHESTLGTAAR